MSHRIRNWVFTSFEVTPPEFDEDSMQYMVFQIECCPRTGKTHYQGYVEFKQSLKMSKVKSLLGSNAIHVEPRKGTQQQAIDYCMKSETRAKKTKPLEFGIRKHQGGRSDLDSMIEMIHDGATKVELLREFRGNAFRHLGMIDRAQRCLLGLDEIDNTILRRRRLYSDLISTLTDEEKAILEN